RARPPAPPAATPPEPHSGGLKPPAGTPGGPPPLPTIQGNNRQLRDISTDALGALRACNNPPTLFQRGGVLTRLRLGEDNTAPVLEPLTDHALRGVLARVADWIKVRETMRGTEVEETPPPLDVVKDLATLPRWDGIPVLRAVVETPVFTGDAGLVRTPGSIPPPGSGITPPPT